MEHLNAAHAAIVQARKELKQAIENGEVTGSSDVSYAKDIREELQHAADDIELSLMRQ